MDRRSFIKATGGLAAMAGLPSHELFAGQVNAESFAEKRLRVVVFREGDFPTPDGERIPDTVIADALTRDASVTYVDGMGLMDLDAANTDVLLTPYGSAFPLDAMDALYRYLRAGGCWVNLRGVPLSRPVTRIGGRWHLHEPQPAGYRPLGISHYHEVAHPPKSVLEKAGPIDVALLLPGFHAASTYALYVKLTTKKSFPDEDGSDGPRETLLRPLVHVIDADSTRLAAPVLVFDQMQGAYAGGRWVFATSRGGGFDAQALRALVAVASTGAVDIRVHLSDACPRPGETVRVRSEIVHAKHARCGTEKFVTQHESPDGQRAELLHAESGGQIVAPASDAASLHRVTAAAVLQTQLNETVRQSHGNGFIVYDASVFSRGRTITVDGMHFRYDGAITPVTGTTHMASDTHRRFLLEPNPDVWRSDFLSMESAGINMVRNGIWTGWALHSEADGSPKEHVLRALEAYYLTARAAGKGIPIIFTFFAFLPEAWGGVNVFLDPKALAAQDRFVGGFARRFRNAKEILWDFINEPSFCSPKHLWSVRPNGDEHEIAAWTRWLHTRFPQAKTERELRIVCATAFRTSPGRALELPRPEDFQEINLHGDRSPLKAAAYRFFAQDMFTAWAAHLRDVVKREAGPGHLVTVGQDEGGAYDRPSTHFHHSAVDFTGLHNWWANDDLLWDGISTKVPGVTHLVEETGVMMYESRYGMPWRSELEAAALLERKCAYAFAAGGAGFIEWIWNTNPFMDSDNEAAIGIHRADGTAKPEFGVMKKYANLFYDRGPQMEMPLEPEVLLVLPHTHMFQTRNLANDATKRAVRALQYHCRTRIHAVSEFGLDRIAQSPRLVLVPSSQYLSDACWSELLDLVKKGSVLYLSGIFDRNEHGAIAPDRLASVGLNYAVRPVATEERFMLRGVPVNFGFRGDRLQRVEKAVSGEDETQQAGTLHELSLDKSVMPSISPGGRIYWTGLPLECSDDIPAIARVYKHLITDARITPGFSMSTRISDSFEHDADDPGIFVQCIPYARSTCYIIVSETSRNAEIRIADKRTGRNFECLVPAGRTHVAWLD